MYSCPLDEQSISPLPEILISANSAHISDQNNGALFSGCIDVTGIYPVNCQTIHHHNGYLIQPVGVGISSVMSTQSPFIEPCSKASRSRISGYRLRHALFQDAADPYPITEEKKP